MSRSLSPLPPPYPMALPPPFLLSANPVKFSPAPLLAHPNMPAPSSCPPCSDHVGVCLCVFGWAEKSRCCLPLVMHVGLSGDKVCPQFFVCIVLFLNCESEHHHGFVETALTCFLFYVHNLSITCCFSGTLSLCAHFCLLISPRISFTQISNLEVITHSLTATRGFSHIF